MARILAYPFEGPLLKTGRFVILSLRQVPSDALHLLLDNIKIVQQPFGCRRNGPLLGYIFI